MKILLTVPSMIKDGGGPSESVPGTALALKSAGADVGIAYLAAGEQSTAAEEAFAGGVHRHAFKGRATRLNPFAYSADMRRRFEDVASGYDFLVVNMNWMFPVWWAAHVACKLGKPYAMMPRGSFSPQRLKISSWKKRLAGVLDRHYARRSRAIWATAEAEASEIAAYLPGVKTAVFPIGLDVSSYSIAETKPEGEKILLYMSRISPIKGLDMLAEVWGRARPRGWKLVIAGPDDRGYAGTMKKLYAHACEPGSYEFRPAVFGPGKSRLLCSASAFVLPTRNENWGIAVAEAMASGLPVICTKGAPWQCLEAERAGWWTDVSETGLETAIRDMASLDAGELCGMGRRGRAWIERNLDWSAIGKRMLGWIAG